MRKPPPSLVPSLIPLVVGLSACPAPPPDAPDGPPPPSPSAAPAPVRPAAPFEEVSLDEAKAAVAKTQAFSLDLYRRSVRPDRNLALSPTSIAFAMGMALGGARGETADEMKQALRFGDDPHDAFGTLMRLYMPEGESKKPYALSVANRLFTDAGLPLKPGYRQLTKDHYRAPAEPLDFRRAPESARQRINAWVSDQTREKIPTLLPEGSVRGDTRMVLTNAVYFKGKWNRPFEKEATKPAAFTTPGGVEQVPTMHQSAQFRYTEADGAQILEMGYRGNDWAMIFALPQAADGLATLEAKITETSLRRWRDAMDWTAVEVAMPRFELKPPEPLALGQILKAMGIEEAFDPSAADFTGIADPKDDRLALSEVFHQAYVKVDERGTEAAAATGVVMKTTSLPIQPKDPKQFRADHPFMFFLVDTRTGAPMFMGRVTDPK